MKEINQQGNKIYIKPKDFFVTGFFVVLFLSLGLVNFMSTSVSAKKINCSSFIHQVDAQKVFDSDRKTFSRLDADHNGVACQGLK